MHTQLAANFGHRAPRPAQGPGSRGITGRSRSPGNAGCLPTSSTGPAPRLRVCRRQAVDVDSKFRRDCRLGEPVTLQRYGAGGSLGGGDGSGRAG